MAFARMVSGIVAALAGLLGREGVATTPSRDPEIGREAENERAAEALRRMADERNEAIVRAAARARHRRAAEFHRRAAARCRVVGDGEGVALHMSHAGRYAAGTREPTAAERAYAEGFWLARDGRRLRPADMDGQHLANTIRLIRRKARARMLADRRAQPYDAMCDCAPGVEDHIGPARPVYDEMLREAERRGLAL